MPGFTPKIRLCPCCANPFLSIIENLGPPEHPEKTRMFAHTLWANDTQSFVAKGCMLIEGTTRVVPYQIEQPQVCQQPALIS